VVCLPRRAARGIAIGVLAIARSRTRSRRLGDAAYRVNLTCWPWWRCGPARSGVLDQCYPFAPAPVSRASARLGRTQGQLQRALIGEGRPWSRGFLPRGLLAWPLPPPYFGSDGRPRHGQLRTVGASLRASPLPMLAFFRWVRWWPASVPWLPARAASRQRLPDPSRAATAITPQRPKPVRTWAWHFSVWAAPSVECRRSADCRYSAMWRSQHYYSAPLLLVPTLTVKGIEFGAAHPSHSDRHRSRSAA